MPEPRVFSVVRRADETGVSGAGRVLDGILFHNGQVVVCWRGDVQNEDGFSSLGVYPSWEAFKHVHIDSHPTNEAQVVFGECKLAERIDTCGLEQLNSDGETDEE